MTGNDLLEAAKAGDVARVREILREDPTLALARAETGETPVMAALYHGHRDLAGELADAILAVGQPLDVFVAASLGRLGALATAIASGGATGYAYDGWTPLHLAAYFGRGDAVERLLAAGADAGARSRNALSNTPLHAALAGGQEAVALLLVEQGADPHAVDAGGHTPLHLAAEAGLVGVARALLTRGADAHVVDAEDRTPLSRAAARNHSAVIDLIMGQR